MRSQQGCQDFPESGGGEIGPPALVAEALVQTLALLIVTAHSGRGLNHTLPQLTYLYWTPVRVK